MGEAVGQEISTSSSDDFPAESSPHLLTDGHGQDGCGVLGEDCRCSGVSFIILTSASRCSSWSCRLRSCSWRR